MRTRGECCHYDDGYADGQGDAENVVREYHRLFNLLEALERVLPERGISSVQADWLEVRAARELRRALVEGRKSWE